MSLRRLRWMVPTTILAIGIVAGPRPAFDTTATDIALPEDLDGYLASAEARFDDVVPGTEKRILWSSAERRPTPIAVAYLHGFSATHRDTSPLAETVAARLGANLFLARLAGHGRGSEPLGQVEAADWIRDAREAYAIARRLGERVVLMGHSTGATIALWLAGSEAGDDLAVVVLLSPNLAPADRRAEVLLWPWGGVIARMIEGPHREWEPANELQERYFTTRYPTRATLPMMAFVQAARSLPLERLETPTFVAYCQDDTVVDPVATERAFARLAGRKRLLAVAPGDPERHLLAGDILSPETTDELASEILAFVGAD